MSFWDYDPDEQKTCPECGHTGPLGEEVEVFEDGLEVSCARCGKRFGFVDAVTDLAETRSAAEAGNPRAKAALPQYEEGEARRKLAEEVKLKSYKDLPDLEGDAIRIDYDRVQIDGDSWTVLRHEGREIWRELAVYDGLWRFKQIFAKTQIRYGRRLAAVEPTKAAWTWVIGEDPYAEEEVNRLNARLARSHEA